MKDSKTTLVQRLFIPLLCGLGVLGYFGADMYLPAFPELQTFFATSEAAVGLTFSVYMFGITIGQLFYGTLSDRFGRKTMLIWSLSLYLIATIACITSANIYELILWRLLQALGACGPMVIWQAIVIDQFSQEKSHHIFAIVFPMLAISPALAPALGGALITVASWPVIFMVLALIGVLLLLAVIFLLHETTQQHTRAAAQINYVQIKQKYQQLLHSSFFMGNVCTLALSSSAYFCYLTASPFILQQMGYSATVIGFSFLPQTLAFMGGGLLSKKIMSAFGLKTMRFCLVAFVGLSWVFFIVTVFFPLTHALQIVLPFSLMAILSGILYPSGMTLALNHFPALAGTAAGLAGSIQAFCAFFTTSILAALLFTGVISLSVMIVLLAFSAWLCFRLLVRSP
ncbi:MAG TPA: Bcr/CflA family efflux MFS transporter [Gammaproteobacteria bacterium]|nr:Bcr/CflA family efflux MFS transporter [Gammaproteobacteria bacterium]